jgi:hypothetical protein
MQFGLPVNALQDGVVAGLLRDKPQKTLPAVIAEGSTGPIVIETLIERTQRTEVPIKVPIETPKFIPAEFKIEIRRDRIKGPLGIEFDGPPYPVSIQIPGTGIWVKVPGFEDGKSIVDKLVRELTKAEVKFSYSISLNSVVITVKGNTLRCEANLGFKLEGKVTQTGIVPAGPTMVTDGKITLVLERNIEWDSTGKLVLRGGSSRAAIDPITSLTSFPTIDPSVILKTNLLLDALSRIFPEAVNHEVNKQLPTDLPGVKMLVDELKKPREVDGNGVLYLRPREIDVYPVTSDGKSISINLAVRCRPQVVFGGMAPDVKDDAEIPLAFPAGSAPQTGSHLEAECRLSTQYVGKLVHDSIGSSGPIRFHQPRLAPAGEGKACIGAELNQDDLRTLLVRKAADQFGSLGKGAAERASIPTTWILAGALDHTRDSVVLKDLTSKPFWLLSCLPEGKALTPKNDASKEKEPKQLVFRIPTVFVDKPLVSEGDWGRMVISLKSPQIKEVYLTAQELKVVVVADGTTQIQLKAFGKK